jgi:FkbM family methyltransferase
MRDLVRYATRLAGMEVNRVAPGVALLTRRRTKDGRRTSPYRAVKVTDRTVIVSPRSADPQYRTLERETYKWLSPKHLEYILTTYEINCVFDVGANNGQYGKLLRGIGYRGDIVSFEPVAENFRRLDRATSRDPHWSAYQLALGRENGSLDMFVVPGTCSSALPASEFGRKRFQSLAEPTRSTVDVRRLDGIIDDVLPAGLADPRLLLKLDTQGFDLEAFAGLGDGSRLIVALQSEVAQLPIYEGMPTMQQSLDVFHAAGFEITGLFPVTRDTRTSRVLEFDCVMVRAESLRKPPKPGAPSSTSRGRPTP